MKQKYAPEPAHIARIHCGVLSGGCGLIADPIEQKRQASDVVDGQCSMPYGAAVALLTGQAGSSVFTERWLQDEAVRTLMQKVECYTTPELDEYYPHEWRAAASVEMDNGQTFKAQVRYALGDPHNPLSWKQLEAGFHELVAPVYADIRQREKLIARIKNLDQSPIYDWYKL